MEYAVDRAVAGTGLVTYHRRQPRPLDIIESLLHQGVRIECFRTKARVTLANFRDLEREHLCELGLYKTPEEKAAHDTPEYWRWSFSEAHARITNGSKATSAGSSKHRVAKAKRMEKARLEPDTDEYERHMQPIRMAAAWGPKRPMQSRGSRKDVTKTFGGKVVARKKRSPTRGG